jgi:hypothetical protein
MKVTERTLDKPSSSHMKIMFYQYFSNFELKVSIHFVKNHTKY